MCSSTVGDSLAAVRPELGQPVHLQLHVAQLPLHGALAVAPAERPVSPWPRPGVDGRRRPSLDRLELHRAGGGRPLDETVHLPHGQHAHSPHRVAARLRFGSTTNLS